MAYKLNLQRKPELDLLPLELDFLYGKALLVNHLCTIHFHWLRCKANLRVAGSCASGRELEFTQPLARLFVHLFQRLNSTLPYGAYVEKSYSRYLTYIALQRRQATCNRTPPSASTVIVARMSPWKWRETKLQPSRARQPNQLLLSFPLFPVQHPGADHGTCI